MKKILPLALSLAFLCQLAHADEGMWLGTLTHHFEYFSKNI